MPESDRNNNLQLGCQSATKGGLLITLEGIDGCGKSTQLEMLLSLLERRGLNCVVTREPGGTSIGEGIRALMTSDASVNMALMTELLLLAAARAQNVAQIIKPALEAGQTVISDRYVDSTVAFQGYGRGIDLGIIDELNRLATGGLDPDLTIIFDIEPELARARASERAVGGLLGALDEERIEFHRRVRKGYLELAARCPQRIRVIDATGSPEEIHREVAAIVLAAHGLEA
jgi:dTMP kinase